VTEKIAVMRVVEIAATAECEGVHLLSDACPPLMVTGEFAYERHRTEFLLFDGARQRNMVSGRKVPQATEAYKGIADKEIGFRVILCWGCPGADKKQNRQDSSSFHGASLVAGTLQ
jgi:hypothetical protein